MLAAAALSPYVDEAVVVERDDLPGGPEHRKGVPQGRHAHLLMPGGLAALSRPALPPLSGPPLTAEERQLLRAPDGVPDGWTAPGPA